MTDKEKDLFRSYVKVQSMIINNGISMAGRHNMESVLIRLGFTKEEIENERLYVL